MHDHIIRAIFHQTVLSGEHLDDNTIVIDELGLQNGLIRADIAVLNGSMVGYEIKAQKDNLSRLPAQIAAYNEIFDKAYIVVAAKHLTKTLEMLPEWWGVYVINGDETGGYLFELYRAAVKNRSRETISIARLLWKDEISNILISDSGITVGRNKNKQYLYQLIAEKYTPAEFGPIALSYMKQRTGWRTGPARPRSYDDCCQPSSM